MKTPKQVTCPECGHIIRETKGKEYHYGSPFQVCPNCKASYVDKSYHEITVEGYYIGHRLYLPVWKLLLSFFFLILLGFALSPTCGWYLGVRGMVIMVFISIIGCVLMVCMDISSLADYFKRMEKLKAKKEESVMRVSNLDYCRRLEEIGMQVRREYLPEDYDKKETQEPVFHDTEG